MKFAILSTIDNLLISLLIDNLKDVELSDFCIVFDSKTISNKNKSIFQKRTDSIFGKFSDINSTLYNQTKSFIPFYFIDNHNSDNARKLYRDIGINCLFNAGTPRKLTENTINIMSNGVVNIHPGILPRFRGCSCVEWAILNDERIGNTAHFMDNDYDAGPIIDIEKYSFNRQSNYVEIRNSVYKNWLKFSSLTLKNIEISDMKPTDGIKQNNKQAKFWEPMSEELELKAILKANQQKYKYQNL